VAKKASKSKQPSFEHSLEQLEEIVSKLESGKLGLAESLEQYEAGARHLKDCYKLLEHAERKIELVSKINEEGKAETDPFDEEETQSLEEKGEARSRRRSARSKQSTGSDVDEESSLF